MRFSLITLLLCTLSLMAVAGDDRSQQLSEKRIVIYAQKNIDSGEYHEALSLLDDGLQQYPVSDVINALKGEALFLLGNIVEAEKYFMEALAINAHNQVAKKYIEEIRDVKSLSVSEEEQEWISVARDKIGDFIVLVIGIWLGTTLNSFGATIRRWNESRKSKKHFIDGDYVAFTDLLEQQAGDNNVTAIRENIDFMLQNKTREEVIQIVNDYVDAEDTMKMFIRMIERHQLWSSVSKK